MEIVRLGEQDYDEWLELLNTVFGRKNRRTMNFEQELPKMCVRDEAHMAKHFAVRENGKICSLLGVYPIPVSIGKTKLMFSTVGNVATLPEYEGRGYMQALLDAAMEELDRIGADASRLGGARQRYNRYGYEACGVQYNVTVNDHGRKHCMPEQTPKLRFLPVGPDDLQALDAIQKLHAATPICAERSEMGNRSLYAALCAWRNRPVLVEQENGSPVGYLSVSADGTQVAEVCGEDPGMLQHIIYRWQEQTGADIHVALAPYEIETVRHFTASAAAISVSSPCHFKIIHFEKVADALMKLKASCQPGLPDGAYVVGIEGWGNLRLYAEDGAVGCEKTDRKAGVTLDRLTASRLLFGPFPLGMEVSYDPFLAAWLPLPLSWNTLDRV